MKESYLANKGREWSINFDWFNPSEASRDNRLFSKLHGPGWPPLEETPGS